MGKLTTYELLLMAQDDRNSETKMTPEQIAAQVPDLLEEHTSLRARVARLEELALNLSSSWHYGRFVAETPNELHMQHIMENLGYWPITEEEIIARRALEEK